MAYTEDGDALEVAFNENDDAKYGDIRHSDDKISIDTMLKWWEPFAKAFHPLAECMKLNEIEPFPMASQCILNTSSELQLDRLWYMALKFWDMPRKEKKLFRPKQLRVDLSEAIQDIVHKRLQN